MEMKIKKVGDIMIPLETYPHIPYWFKLRQAVAEMETTMSTGDTDKSFSRLSLLVFDEKYQLIGMVRRRDLIRGIDAEALQHIFVFDKLMEKIQEQADHPISDVMIPIKTTVDYEDSIIHVVHQLVKNDLSFLSVLKDKEVVGIVAIEDVFHEIAQLIMD